MCLFDRLKFTCGCHVRRAFSACDQGSLESLCADWRLRKHICQTTFDCPFCYPRAKGFRLDPRAHSEFPRPGWSAFNDLYWPTPGHIVQDDQHGDESASLLPQHSQPYPRNQRASAEYDRALASELERFYQRRESSEHEVPYAMVAALLADLTDSLGAPDPFATYDGLRLSLKHFWEEDAAMRESQLYLVSRGLKKSIHIPGVGFRILSRDMASAMSRMLKWRKERRRQWNEIVLDRMRSGRRTTLKLVTTKPTRPQPFQLRSMAISDTFRSLTPMCAYRGLDPVSQQIRLLEVHPRAAKEEIRCSFQYVNLGNVPFYTALSYTWGDEGHLEKIKIAGSGEIGIRENLLAYLRMRSATLTEPTLFWIDAICINQSNVHERNHQVNLMKEIYASAATVDIWLGDEADDSDVAINYINTKARLPLFPVGLGYKKVWTQRVGRALSELCERSYWKRIWIIQEVCHASHITVWCGHAHFSWLMLESLYLRLKTLEDTSWFAHHRFAMRVLQSSACVMIWQRAHWQDPSTPQPSLKMLIEVFYAWQCVDIRDKVYALIGMADPKTTIPPDYSKTALQIYHDVVERNDEYGTTWCSLFSQVLAIPQHKAELPGRQMIDYKQQPAQHVVLQKKLHMELDGFHDLLL